MAERKGQGEEQETDERKVEASSAHAFCLFLPCSRRFWECRFCWTGVFQCRQLLKEKLVRSSEDRFSQCVLSVF